MAIESSDGAIELLIGQRVFVDCTLHVSFEPHVDTCVPQFELLLELTQFDVKLLQNAFKFALLLRNHR